MDAAANLAAQAAGDLKILVIDVDARDIALGVDSQDIVERRWVAIGQPTGCMPLGIGAEAVQLQCRRQPASSRHSWHCRRSPAAGHIWRGCGPDRHCGRRRWGRRDAGDRAAVDHRIVLQHAFARQVDIAAVRPESRSRCRSASGPASRHCRRVLPMVSAAPPCVSFFRMMLTTPAIASDPYCADAPSRSTSIRWIRVARGSGPGPAADWPILDRPV